MTKQEYLEEEKQLELLMDRHHQFNAINDYLEDCEILIEQLQSTNILSIKINSKKQIDFPLSKNLRNKLIEGLKGEMQQTVKELEQL